MKKVPKCIIEWTNDFSRFMKIQSCLIFHHKFAFAQYVYGTPKAEPATWQISVTKRSGQK